MAIEPRKLFLERMSTPATPATQVTWYVARNHLGEFSRGEDWVPDIADARLYRSIGPAKSAGTKWAKKHPAMPVPEVLEWRLDIATATVLDVSEQTEKRIRRAAANKRDRERWQTIDRLRELEAQEKRIAEERARLKEETNGGEGIFMKIGRASSIDDSDIPVCPTCKSQRWAEIHPSKTDPTGLTLYCRRCEEGCVSPLLLPQNRFTQGMRVEMPIEKVAA